MTKKIIKQLLKAAARPAVKAAKKAVNANPQSKLIYQLAKPVVKPLIKKLAKATSKRARRVTAPVTQGFQVGGNAPMIQSTNDTKQVMSVETWPVAHTVDGEFVLADSDGWLMGPFLKYFPVLANEAYNYQKYRCTHLELIYRPLYPTSAPGQFFCGWLDDPVDVPPESLAELSAVRLHQRTPVWKETTFRIPMDGKEHYCDIDISSDAELRQNFLGRFFCGTMGVAEGNYGTIEMVYNFYFMRRTGVPSLSTAVSWERTLNGSATQLFATVTKGKLSTWINYAQPNPSSPRILLGPAGKYTLSLILQSEGADHDLAGACRNIAVKKQTTDAVVKNFFDEIVGSRLEDATEDNVASGIVDFKIPDSAYIDFSALTEGSWTDLSGEIRIVRTP